MFKKSSEPSEETQINSSNDGVETNNYTEYAQDVEHFLFDLESRVHTSNDPKDIAVQSLKTACEFYQGDWAGIVVADTNVDIWTPLWWYNTNPVDRTGSLIKEFESSEYFGTWISGFQDDEAIIVPNTEEVIHTNPGAYEVYQRLRVKSVIAIPFKLRPTGFLIVRNPQRYVERTSMLQMLSFIASTAVNEKRLLERGKLVPTPADIKNDTDIVINVFGTLEIYTSKGVLRESDFNSPKISRLLIYMLLNNRSAHPPREIADAIWPEEITDPETAGKNMRGLVYRCRQIFSVISDYQMIESTAGGYRINPALHIMTDMQSFERAVEAVKSAATITHKIEYIMRAIGIYKGEMYPPASGEHWMAGTSTYYSLRYMSLINELLVLLAGFEEWDDVSRYASQSLLIMPGNVQAYFWLVYSMYRTGAIEMAKEEVKRAKETLTGAEYTDLIKRLLKAKNETSVQS